MKKYFKLLLFFSFFFFLLNTQVREAEASGLNTNNVRICRVTTLQDNAGVVGSLRRALDQGYNLNNPVVPGLCADKIEFGISGTVILNQAINLNNRAVNNFILEKDPAVSGDLILDASRLPEGTCAITVAANSVTLQGLSIQGARGSAICLESGSTGNTLTNLVLRNNQTGVWVKAGSQGSNITNNKIYDNTGYGVNLDEATQNRVSQNAIYRNLAGAVESPASNLQVTIDSAAPTSAAANAFNVSGSVANAIDHIEFYRSVPIGLGSNFIVSESNLPALRFVTLLNNTRAGEDIFAIAIGADGSTGPSTAVPFYRLSAAGTGTPTPGTNGTCSPGQILPATQFFDRDRDGIPDSLEDTNANCVVDAGETDAGNSDTDGDGISDGVEDRNHNGIRDMGESDPRLVDSDGDRIPDGLEDRNHNGITEPDELNPNLADTDGDGISDQFEDLNRNGIRDTDESDGTLVHSDGDGLADGSEDTNHNGIVDILETDPRLYDTDGDGRPDNSDVCPRNASLVCVRPCVVGEIPPATLDTDGDRIPDAQEDINNNCNREAFETDPYNRDTDGDGSLDSGDSCPLSSEAACVSACVPGAFVPANRDSDADGITDVEEDINRNCSVDPGESNPFAADTDMDAIRDFDDQCPQDRNPLCTQECVPGLLPPEDQDSDGDGLTDREEDLNRNCIADATETSFRLRDSDNDGLYDNIDPCATNPDLTCASACVPGAFVPARRDSDRDGIPDILEDVDNNCIRSVTETDAFNADTDADGIPDGVEDRNFNGVVDAGETNPRLSDSDQDGIADGLEDRNHNGIVDFGELNPAASDTDGDSIPDRIEDTNLNGIFDRGETNGALADTDQDGIRDGDEDKNHNGRVDAGETDPRSADSDGDGASDGQELDNSTNPLNSSSADFNQALGKGGCSLDQNAPFHLSGTSLILLLGIFFFWRLRNLRSSC